MYGTLPRMKRNSEPNMALPMIQKSLEKLAHSNHCPRTTSRLTMDRNEVKMRSLGDEGGFKGGNMMPDVQEN